MSWKIEFYNKNVESSIKGWPDDMMPRFLWLLNVIEKIGPNKLSMPYVKALGQGLFKISVKGQQDTGSALFCLSAKDKVVIILTGFVEIPSIIELDEVGLARTRMTEFTIQ